MFDTWTDDQFAAWLAGFFDGEGCIQVPKVGIDVSIAGTERAVIEAIQTKLGVGTITEVTYDRPEWRTKYHWRVRNYPQAQMVLRMMRPFLTIKAAKADEALVRTAAWGTKRSNLAERNRRILELAAEGMPYNQISKMFGLDSRSRTVGYIVRGMIRDGSHPLKAQNIRELRRTHDAKSVKSAGLGVKTSVKLHARPRRETAREAQVRASLP